MLRPLWKPNKTIWLRATGTNTSLSLPINLARNVDFLPTLFPVADMLAEAKCNIYLSVAFTYGLRDVACFLEFLFVK